MATILGANTLSSGFDVANSVRFNSADSASMEKNAGTPTDNNKWTFSAWVKRSKLGSLQEILYGDDGSTTNYCTIRFNDTSDTLTFKNRPGSTTSTLTTKRVFRDISAWYHLVVVLDTSNGTAANRDIIYINGVRETSYSTESHSGDGDACYINFDGDPIKISKGRTGSFFDGYMSEVYFIDGQALAADSFGEFDEDSGIWKPIDASGLTFGNNGFYLDFKASGNLGNDANGGTDLTESNLAATDQSIDTCTNNFCTPNSLYPTGDITFSEGNLKTVSETYTQCPNGTLGAYAGKWYYEVKMTTTHGRFGWCESHCPQGDLDTSTTFPAYAVYSNGSNGLTVYKSVTAKASTDNGGYTSFSDGDTLGIAFDIDNGKFYAHLNGTYYNSGDPPNGTGALMTGIAAQADGLFIPLITFGTDSSRTFEWNFGSPAHSISSGNADGNGFGNFEYAPPSGFLAICSKNIASTGG